MFHNTHEFINAVVPNFTHSLIYSSHNENIPEKVDDDYSDDFLDSILGVAPSISRCVISILRIHLPIASLLGCAISHFSDICHFSAAVSGASTASLDKVENSSPQVTPSSAKAPETAASSVTITELYDFAGEQVA